MLFPYKHDNVTNEELCHDIREEIKHLMETSQKSILVILARSLDIYLEENDEIYAIANLILREIRCIKNPPLIKEWAKYEKITSEAEKESDPDSWSAELIEAYDLEDWKKFSRLRGYTEDEINDYDRSMELTKEITNKYFDGNYDPVMSIIHDVNQGAYTFDDIINDEIDVFF